MDEILASIRRIISEDEGAPRDAADNAYEGHGGEPEADVLVLTDRLPPDAPSPHDSYHDAASANGASPAEAVPPSPPDPAPSLAPSPPNPAPAQGGGGDSRGVAEASEAFEKLYLAVESAAAPAVSSGGPTLEDVARDLLRPMIADWLDENLAEIVRARVDQEVERIARGRVR